MNYKIKNEKELLEEISVSIKTHLIKIFRISGKEISDKEAETLICNTALYLMNKNEDIILK